MSDSERRARAQARRRYAVIRRGRLQPLEADLSPVSGADAVSLVYRLTMESWALARRAEPTYTRDRIPFRFVRGRPT